jgi:hypothetical protein
MNKTQTSPSAASGAAASLAWWRVSMVWLVVGGPAAVVLASFVTLYLAVSHPDPVLPALPVASADGDGDAAVKSDPAKAAALQPALVGRNHSATAGQVR